VAAGNGFAAPGASSRVEVVPTQRAVGLRYRAEMEREDVQAAIRSAFAGVRLGSGVSLRQAQIIDVRGRGMSHAEFESLPRSEVTEDWTAIPDSELVRDCVGHLDAHGLRYYLPALMLWLLDHYDDEDRLFTEGADMTAIGTVSALAFSSEFETSYREIFGGFTREQRAAIASFIEALPRLVELDDDDATRVASSLESYWAQFLP
jgi:hypothetical protein